MVNEQKQLYAVDSMKSVRLLRCFYIVFRRPHRCFSIALKVFLSLSDRHKIFTSDWLWTEVCQNAVFRKKKNDISMTTITKTFKIDSIQILRDLDLLLKIRHQELTDLVFNK